MNDKKFSLADTQISGYFFESATVKLERANRRLWITNIILIATILAIVGWVLWDRSQWETVETTEVSQEIDTGDGYATITGIGDIDNGENQTDSYKD